MKYVLPVLGLIVMGVACYVVARGGYGVEAIIIVVGNSMWVMGAKRIGVMSNLYEKQDSTGGAL